MQGGMPVRGRGHNTEPSRLPDFSRVETPCYLLDCEALRRNADIMGMVARESGGKILLALKAFAAWKVFDEIEEQYAGTCCASLNEARLGYETFKGEVHAFSPAFKESEMEEYLKYCSHLSFNSLSQWDRHRDMILSSGSEVSCGLRVNPEHSEVTTEIYNPCKPGSRFGILLKELEGADMTGLEGLHFHSLCESGADALERTLDAFTARFGPWLGDMKWVNFGGGHHITREDYDTDLLIRLVREFREEWGVEVYLEPGEACALNAGWMVSEVIDIVENNGMIAIIDASAVAHMPDILEMPYRPEIIGAGLPGEKKYTYRLGGPTCLSGDDIGEYSFDSPLKPGDHIVFTDMAHYTMVKNTIFNGVPLPSIATWNCSEGELITLRKFGYEDFVNRLN
ncbi:carboxynorspermidine decarboxylase [Methanomicrobiaceae archaeon CYW5]|nr:carboxynorspermidine decarboxylase [Methanovulcanius yangii]